MPDFASAVNTDLSAFRRESTSPLSDSRPRTPTPPPEFALDFDNHPVSDISDLASDPAESPPANTESAESASEHANAIVDGGDFVQALDTEPLRAPHPHALDQVSHASRQSLQVSDQESLHALDKLLQNGTAVASGTPLPLQKPDDALPFRETPHDDRPSKRRRVGDSGITSATGVADASVAALPDVASATASKTTTTSSRSRKRAESPPWKNAAAEGPTTILENGRRKSGRISSVQQLQHQRQLITSPLPSPSLSSKRPSRADAAAPSSSSSSSRSTTAAATSRQPAASPVSRSAAATSSRSAASSRRPGRAAPADSQPSRSGQRNTARNSHAPSRSSRRLSASPPPQPTRQSSRPSRPTRKPQAYTSPAPERRPRISTRTLRGSVFVHTELPLVHPGQVPLRKRIGSSFEDYWNVGSHLPMEQGGLVSVDDGPRYTDEMASKDAQAILKIEQELEPGGILSEQRCSLFVPETIEEPPRQWAHYDHLIKAAQNFRRLMILEQTRHRATAKKLAEACRDEWIRRQPKSDEQLEAEARVLNIAKYRIVCRSIAGMWENVRVDVNRQRLARWEAEEQKRVKAALNEAVNKSEQKLQARRTTMGDNGSDEELDDVDMDLNLEDDLNLMTDSASSGSGSGSESVSENESGQDDMSDSDDDQDNDDDDMSSSDDDGDAAGSEKDKMKTEANGNDGSDDDNDDDDENLTAEQLRAKYAGIPDVGMMPERDGVSATAEDKAVEDRDESIAIADDDSETSDESIDMDDDLGSSEMSETGSDEEEEEEEDSESEDDATGGLLGMLFGKQELKSLKQEHTPEDSQSNGQILESVERGDEVESASLRPGPLESPKSEDSDQNTNKATLMMNGVGEKGKQGEAASSVVVDDGVSENNKPGTEKTPRQSSAAAASAAVSASTSIATQQNGIHTTASTLAPADAQKDETQVDKPPKVNPPPSTEAPSTEPSSTESPSNILSTAPLSSKLPSTDPPATDKAPKTEIPFLLRGNLREYQHYGLDWLAGLYANNTNGILADEMGLGKTIQTISLLAHLACHHGIWGPHLVVVPTSVMLNWEMEFKKWCPGFKIMAYYGSIEERRRKRMGWNNDDLWNVCITSYQLVLQDNQVFRRRKWHYLILDEAHNIKNFKSLRWQTLLGFNTQARLLITGTPLQNNLTELWSLLFFLMPSEKGVGGFADLQEFHDWFSKPESQILESGKEQLDEEGRAIISKLHKVLRPYLLRRLKADVEKQMPAKYEHVEFCRLSKRQRELYDGFLARSDTRATLAGGNYLSIINCLMQLRKVCNHPDLFVDRPIQTSLRLDRSVPAEFLIVDKIVRRTLLAQSPATTVNLSFLNLTPTANENMSSDHARRILALSADAEIRNYCHVQAERVKLAPTTLDPTTIDSSIKSIEASARRTRLESLTHCLYLNGFRTNSKPVLGKNLTDFLTLVDTASQPWRRQRPRVPAKIMEWFENGSFLLKSAVKDVNQRSAELETTIQKFACVTPAVVTRDMAEIVLGRKASDAFHDHDLRLSKPVRWSPFIPPEPPVDPWHEARIRLSIQFPDKRLLQYDCGKLQALDRLLRKLQAGGHRALIFTQMTRVLDILEQFLNIHGHKYLRLDGATKVEQRQLLTDRFNSDKRILCFILSTRSGGLGINLTGADTVIFYDQDWNPAMDKQCQDRCHRIGQTRDVHIYRLVSEHTIEANILRKASQKQMLDDVVIQDGGFTTDYFSRLKARERAVQDAADADDPEADLQDGIAAASAAMDRVLGATAAGNPTAVGHELEQAEDREDVTAARAAEKEIHDDEADFSERASRDDSQSVRPSEAPSEPATATSADTRDQQVTEYTADGRVVSTIDEYMVQWMEVMLQGTALEIPKDKKKSKTRKRGKDSRRR
ncbi:hypothetical protein TD95_001423 [Thielaviopsis punctulata]|uniref:DNA helicase n=1 Tax=Thielaviopsis punctulata TaxID=72032 RepID=A0A0F4ZCF3_9PEZI|nr:hypothetical protein TD95_001423 [Thielaviopsis punctulata]